MLLGKYDCGSPTELYLQLIGRNILLLQENRGLQIVIEKRTIERRVVRFTPSFVSFVSLSLHHIKSKIVSHVRFVNFILWIKNKKMLTR